MQPFLFCKIYFLRLTSHSFLFYYLIFFIIPKCFLRGMPHLCTHVRRQDRGRPSQEQYCQNFTNPDFDAISQDHPLPPLHQETSNHQYLLPSSQSQSTKNSQQYSPNYTHRMSTFEADAKRLKFGKRGSFYHQKT